MVAPLGIWGAPLAGGFWLAAGLRRLAYDRGWLPTVRAPIMTISVGGLEAGGSGKTPVARAILTALATAGIPVGLLSRGYGRSSRGLIVRRRGEAVDPARLGDEPAMMVASGLDVPVAVCARRADGAFALVELGCQAAVLDDGFSHRALVRDLDIVVLRGEAPWGTGHLLPWGSLREPASSLRRAHVVWVNFRDRPPENGLPPGVTAKAPEATWVTSVIEPGPIVDAAGVTVQPARQRVVAVTAIARPSGFVNTLRSLSLEVGDVCAFHDHHRYSPIDVERIAARVARDGAAAAVTTEKDAVKLLPIWKGSPLWIVKSRLSVISGRDRLAQQLGIPQAMLP